MMLNWTPFMLGLLAGSFTHSLFLDERARYVLLKEQCETVETLSQVVCDRAVEAAITKVKEKDSSRASQLCAQHICIRSCCTPIWMSIVLAFVVVWAQQMPAPAPMPHHYSTTERQQIFSSNVQISGRQMMVDRSVHGLRSSHGRRLFLPLIIAGVEVLQVMGATAAASGATAALAAGEAAAATAAAGIGYSTASVLGVVAAEAVGSTVVVAGTGTAVFQGGFEVLANDPPRAFDQDVTGSNHFLFNMRQADPLYELHRSESKVYSQTLTLGGRDPNHFKAEDIVELTIRPRDPAELAANSGLIRRA